MDEPVAIPNRGPDWRMLIPWGIGGALIFGAYLLGLPVCPAKRILGIPCPGCGMTRAAVDLLTLNVTGAWHMQPLVFLVGPLFGWLLLSSVLGEERLRMPPAWLWVVLGVALVLVWGLRLGHVIHLAAL